MMERATANPPRNGEGDREAAEGSAAAGLFRSIARLAQPGPSASPSDCHLPVPGRIFAVEAL
jgi:hypothetical protein